MPHLPFKTVDVFTAEPFLGNPVAVVLDAGALTDAQMQRIANWTNLSETTFVLPPTEAGADYQVRIFTPLSELPFAGHPTIGTAHALLEAGRIAAKDGRLVQQCEAGLITLDVTHGAVGARWIHFTLPEAQFAPLRENNVAELEAILRADVDQDAVPCVVDVGPRWVVAQLKDAQAVLDLQPDLRTMALWDRASQHTGVIVFGPHAGGGRAAIEVRAFAPAAGVNEDPVCGSGNGAIAAYLRYTGQVDRFGADFLATQGAAVGRAGVLRLSISDEAIRVGGNAVTCVDGHLNV